LLSSDDEVIGWLEYGRLLPVLAGRLARYGVRIVPYVLPHRPRPYPRPLPTTPATAWIDEA